VNAHRRIRILLADDHAVLRAGLRALLAAQADLEVVGEASDGAQAIRLTQALRPDVVVMDIGMPGVSGIDATARIKRELHQQLGREATDDELAEESGIPAHKIADLLDHSRDPVSLDMPVGNDEEAPLGDFIEDSEATSAENAVIAGLLHSDVRSVLGTLDEREQQVIRLRYGLDDGQPRTLDQIGKLFGLSRERVRQIEREVMGKLRVGDRAEKLRSYAS